MEKCLTCAWATRLRADKSIVSFHEAEVHEGYYCAQLREKFKTENAPLDCEIFDEDTERYPELNGEEVVW